MGRTKAVFFEHFIMKFRAVAFVFVKTILGKFFVKPQHFGVSRFFGDYRSGGYYRHFFISSDYCFLIVMLWRKKGAVQ